MSNYNERAKNCLAQGFTGTNSKRYDQFIQGVYPQDLVAAQGPYVWDDTGKRYIDFIGALGANLLGYKHPKVNEAVIDQINTGYVSGSLPYMLEVEVAEKICNMFHVERVRFVKTGNEATLAAVRIARAYSNKPTVLTSGYHGHGDLWTALTPPATGVKDYFNVARLEHASQMEVESCGALVLETLELDDSEGYLNGVKNTCNIYKDRKIPIIHDEIVSGGRVEAYSVCNKYELDPDILCLGKGLANGYSISVVAGKKELMDNPDYFISSTFSGEAVSLAAASATLDVLSRHNMKDYVFYAKRFQARLNVILEPLDVQIKGYGTRGMYPSTKNEQAALFMQEACKAGLLFGKGYYFSMAHLEYGIEDYALGIANDVVLKILRGGVKLEGKAPQETFRRY